MGSETPPLMEHAESSPALPEDVAIPDSLREAWARVEASKHGPRMKRALARVASGESYRQSADAEGYSDHMKLWRLSKRYGLLGAKKEQILAGSRRVALLANQELERRLTERPDEISDRDVTVMGGVAVDKVSAAEGWSKQNTEHESYGSALESLVRRLTESGATFELKVTHPDPADRAIDVTPESSQG